MATLEPFDAVQKRAAANKKRVFAKRPGSTESGFERAFEREFPELAITPKFSVSKTDPIFTIGSCFARNIESALYRNGVRAITMDCLIPGEYYNLEGGARNGALNAYTPSSMLDTLRWVARQDRGTAGALEVSDGKLADMMLNGLRALAPEELAEVRGMVFDTYARLADAKLVIITLGYTESWFDNQDNIWVNRAPAGDLATRRHAGNRYSFHNMSAADVMECLEAIVGHIREETGNRANIIFTTSPVPLTGTYTRHDVISANLYSKCTLLSSAVSIAGKYDFVDYYPSYEMINYSDPKTTWEADGIHVKMPVVNKAVQTFLDAYLI